MKKHALIALVALSACGNNNANNSASQSSSGGTTGDYQALSNMDSGAIADDAAVAAVEAAAPTPPPVRVVAGTRTELPAGLAPTVAFRAPRANQIVRGTSFAVQLNVRDWPAPQDMRHVHLILDNQPYIRIDNPAQPHTIEGLTPGTHTLRAFPGWGTHESVKRDGAFAMVTFHVERRSEENNPAARAPLLTYSRPKGAYNGADANRVLLDFYLTNVPALSATGFRVRYAIDGSTNGEITEWVPHFIENLQDGSHTITLDLLGADGQPAAGPFNHVERQITVDHTPAPVAAATPGSDAGASHAGH